MSSFRQALVISGLGLLFLIIVNCGAAQTQQRQLSNVQAGSDPWFADQWVSSSKRHTQRGACHGEFDEDATLVLYSPNSGEFELNYAFYSDRGSSDRCEDSDDSMASLDMTYKVSGSSSSTPNSVVVNATLNKCQEEGSYHECDSVPRTLQLTVRRQGSDSVVVVGDVAGTSERTLTRYKSH